MHIIPLAIAAIAVASHPAAASSYQTYSEPGTPFVQNPGYPLLVYNGALYGTSSYGGADNRGTAFAVTPTGQTILHSFGSNGADGIFPTGLLNVNGLFYGTAEDGGASGRGVIYTLDPAFGAETVIYNFTSSPDAADPGGPLIQVGQTLYGESGSGGGGVGTVFQFDLPSGAETVVYRFKNNHQDGANPNGALLAYAGALWGSAGGGSSGDGAIYKIAIASGAEKVVHSFNTVADGGMPSGALVALNGMLYGTCYEGGRYGEGTVFAIAPTTGSFTVVHAFNEAAGEGGQPIVGLLAFDGLLYGTTRDGGAKESGAVFSLDPVTGAYHSLHDFAGYPHDGSVPDGALIAVGSMLYGTTSEGGAENSGTLFRLPR